MSEEKDKDDRTEEPTQRRLDQAMERGDVARSVEIGTFFVLSGFTLALMIGSGQAAQKAALALRAFLMNAHQVVPTAAGFQAVTTKGVITGFTVMAIPLGLVLATALAGALIQHKPLWTLEPLAPKLSRISPLSGAKRMFGKEALANFLKGLAKILLVGITVSVVLWGERDRLDSFARMETQMLLPATLALTLKLMVGVLSVYGFLALADYVWQRFSWHKRQMMTRQELKDEFKETEGNPEIKAKVRQIRARQAKQRMMAKVPKATVIVTNPTHFAVALQYEAGMAAPVCLAKGVDAVALKIREIAGENEVPIVENPPLARALYATVDLDEEIPAEHYQAVAEVIGYVLRLKRRRA